MPLALLTVAMVVLSTFQVTDEVMSTTEPSAYVPFAVSATVVPRGIVGLAGVMVIDTSGTEVTVTVAPPLMAPRLAVILLTPAPCPVTTPAESAALETNAMVLESEVHVTLAVKSAVVPSA